MSSITRLRDCPITWGVISRYGWLLFPFTSTKHVPQDRYSSFLHMVREYRHLKLLKRMGRGHTNTLVDDSNEGSCALLCPACPHPGKNLPDDWQTAPPNKSYALLPLCPSLFLTSYQLAIYLIPRDRRQFSTQTP